MIKHLLYSVVATVAVATTTAAPISPERGRIGWLPTEADRTGDEARIRLLSCRYDGARLVGCDEIAPDSEEWTVSATVDTLPLERFEGRQILRTYTFTARRPLESAGVAIAFDRRGWSSDNYVMIPASVYNGNRQRIVHRAYATGLDRSDYRQPDLALTSNPIPQLSPDFGAESRLEVLVNNAASPAVVWYERSRGRGYVLLTDQGIEKDGEIHDNALIVEEAPDRSTASVVVGVPGVRARKPEFIGFSESPDRGLSWAAGERFTVQLRLVEFAAANVPEVLTAFGRVRKLHTGPNRPRHLKPASEVMRIMTRNIDRRYLRLPQWEYYCPENADWISFGWIGGMMNTYPMLALGDAEHLRRVAHTYDFALPRAQGEAGFFYGTLGSDGRVFGRDAAREHPEVVLTRMNADVLYWMVKQFLLLKAQGRGAAIRPEWEASIRRLADAFVATYDRYGTWGNFLNVETGEVEIYGTTSGAMAPAALGLASVYFDRADYLETALAAAEEYYRTFAVVGFTSGGCGDILQNADSETAVAFLTSCNLLFELTGDDRWLERAEQVAALCATWIVSFDYVLPAETELGGLGTPMAGAVWASTQNKHGAPGFCTSSADALFRLYRSTGDRFYADLLHDVWHAYVEGIRPNGFITERLTYCDAELRGTRGPAGDGGTGWNELNGCLMATELPGIYVRSDLEQVYAFDHIDARIKKSGPRELVLTLTNTTPFDAEVSILSETAAEAAEPLSPVAFVEWDKTTIPAGRSVDYRLRRKP
ncbi:MAG: hypothetical protein K2G93_04120 [Rikenella sp.]|nr:hypothetical protein [Rikenella sp.]